MKGYFVYMFLDDNEEVLYIGISIHLVNRIESQHFLSQHGNLSEECILQTHKVLYHQCLSDSDMKIKERYLINTLVPKYNNKMNQNDRFSFVIDNINWKLYSIDNEGLNEKRKVLSSKNYKISLKNHKIDFTINSNLTINNLDNLWILGFSFLHHNENEDLPNDWRPSRGGYPEDYFYLIKINNELYIYCDEILRIFGNYKKVTYVNDFDDQYIYPNIKELKAKYDLDSFLFINCKEKSGIFQKYSHEGLVGESYLLNPREQLFMKYDLLKNQKMIDEFWILRIDWAIKNYKRRHKIDWVKMRVYDDLEIETFIEI